MAYFTFTQKTWSLFLIMTLIFASVTVEAVSYAWLTISSLFGIVLIIGILEIPFNQNRLHVHER